MNIMRDIRRGIENSCNVNNCLHSPPRAIFRKRKITWQAACPVSTLVRLYPAPPLTDDRTACDALSMGRRLNRLLDKRAEFGPLQQIPAHSLPTAEELGPIPPVSPLTPGIRASGTPCLFIPLFCFRAFFLSAPETTEDFDQYLPRICRHQSAP